MLMYHRDCYSRMMFNFPIVMKEMACPNYLKFVEVEDKLKVLKTLKGRLKGRIHTDDVFISSP